MSVTTTITDDSMSTRCDIPAGDIAYAVMFTVRNDGYVSIVAGVMDWDSNRCVASNSALYAGTRSYSQ